MSNRPPGGVRSSADEPKVDLLMSLSLTPPFILNSTENSFLLKLSPIPRKGLMELLVCKLVLGISILKDTHDQTAGSAQSR